jgi:pimeloyl-ACP methyl ester carboxylesterase
VRYDKRGFGQSGGRSESATLQDHGEDVRAIVKWLQSREDVDDRRIAVIGHGEGAWVAIQAAARENKIAAVVSLAGPGTTGAELVLEQQQMARDAVELTPTGRDQRVALRKLMQDAGLSGRGGGGISPEMRQDAETPWVQSFLAFSPA